MNKPVICIDTRLFGIKHTGIGRYVENLISHLPDQSNTQTVVITHPDFKNHPVLDKYKKYYAACHPYSLLSQLEMFWLLLKIRPSLLHVPHFTVPVLWPGKTVITIHDLIKHISVGSETTTRSPLIYWLKHAGYLLITKIAIQRAIQIIVPAHYWKDEIVRRYHLDPEKISVTYEGVDQTVFYPAPKIYEPRPYVIYTGNIYPHKNIPVLLQAVKTIPEKISLIIVCGRSVFSQRLDKMLIDMELKSRVKVIYGATDSVLRSLYQNSLAFVTPSKIEGFGLPGLEAMACGTPVIAAQASCLPEIYGSAAVYFDPQDPKQLSEIILDLFSHPEKRKLLTESGLNQVKKYSWGKMGAQTWSIYQNALL